MNVYSSNDIIHSLSIFFGDAVLKRIVPIFLFIFIFSALFLPTAFASVKLDGSITPDELEDSNLQVQCENGNSGCGIHVFVTYYKPFPDSSEIYLALASELDGEQILADGPFGFEIYIENSPVIRIHTNSRADFDTSYYDVKVSNRIDFSCMRCETSILFKNHMPDTPKIYVKAIDNEGVPSKSFKINTVMPETTTKPAESTGKPSYNFTLPDFDITKKTTELYSNPKNETTLDNGETNGENVTPTQHINNENSHDSGNTYATQKDVVNVNNSDEKQKSQNVSKYDLSIQTVDKENPASKKRNRLVLTCAVAVTVILAGAATTGIKASFKKRQ